MMVYWWWLARYCKALLKRSLDLEVHDDLTTIEAPQECCLTNSAMD